MSTALIRGLEVLEIIAGKHQQVGFNEINRELGDISRASLSRLLKALLTNGFICKDPVSGLYSSGHRMSKFATVKTPGRKEYLIAQYGPLMKKISRTYDVTVILLERVIDILVSIHKEQTEFSYNMQPVDNINDDYSEPWLLTVAAFTTELGNKIKGKKNKNLIGQIREKGFYFEDQSKRKNVRRLAFPLFDDKGKVIAIFGIGGSILQLDDKRVKKCISEIRSFTNNNQ